MDVRFSKPELDFQSSDFFGGSVEVRVSAMYGCDKYAAAARCTIEEIGSERWPYIVHDLHLTILESILRKYPPTDYTIKQRR